MATVYRAHDRRLDVHRAIKVLTPTYASNAELRKRFLAEARVLARLYHPNIVMCHDIGVDGDRLYIVMELVEGGGLWERMREAGPLAPAQALDVMEAVLPALQVAHDQGVVHRDIKPGNILVGKDGTYKLADFGIARAAQVDDDTRTKTGSMLGTPSYMAPEQWSSGRELDARADIFAMGATLYSLVTLQTPQDIHINEMQDEQLRDVHPAISAIIRKACRYRANERFQTATEMLASVQTAHGEMSSLSANTTVGGVRRATAGAREQVAQRRKGIRMEPAAHPMVQAEAQRPTLTPDNLTPPPSSDSARPAASAASYELNFRPSDGQTPISHGSGQRVRPADVSSPRASIDGPSQIMRRPVEVSGTTPNTPVERPTTDPTARRPLSPEADPILTPKQIGLIGAGLLVVIALALFARRGTVETAPETPLQATTVATPTPEPVPPTPPGPAPEPVTPEPGTPEAQPAAPAGPQGTLEVECRPTCEIWIDHELRGTDKVSLKVEAGQRQVSLESAGGKFRALKVVPPDGAATLCYDFGAKAFCAN